MNAEQKDIAVVLCDCGRTLSDHIDFARLRKHLSGLPAVATVKLCSALCRQNECDKVMESIAEKKPNRLVIGACDRQIFEQTLRRTIAGRGSINEGLIWSVNIREHCGWVTATAKSATDKSIEVLDAAVRRVMRASALKSSKVRVNQDVLVLGGGVAAMQTAVAVSGLGHNVTVLEQSDKLGGLAAQMPQFYSYLGSDSSEAASIVQTRLDGLVSQIENDKQIRVCYNVSLKSVAGQLGGFTVAADSNGSSKTISAGAIVLAVGASCSADTERLAALINNGEQIPRRIAIVTDVFGEQGRAVSAQVLSAAELLAGHFAAEVKLFCRNVRVAATGLESLYQRARQAGAVIVKYELPPVISEDAAKKVVCVADSIIGSQLCEEFDLVVMADANTQNGHIELLNLLQALRCGPGQTLQPDSVWLLPARTNRPGIFVVGAARGNSEFRDAQADALAAADQIHELLKSEQIELIEDAPVVDSDKCVLCLTCMRICPHGAVSIDVENAVASISQVVCQRCGICAAECPAAAIQLPRYTDEQIAAELGEKPQVTVFACENSALPAATAAGINGGQYQKAVQLIRVPCAGKVDPRDILQALERGAEKVLILGCHVDACKYLNGASHAEKRFQRLTKRMEKAGVDTKRVVFGQLACVEPQKFLEYINM